MTDHVSRLAGSDADFEAWEHIGAEMLDDGLDAIVSASGALFAETQRAKRQGDIVIDDEHLFRQPFVKREHLPDGVSNSSGAVGRYLMDHPVQLTRALSPTPVWQRRGPQEVSSIHEMRDGDHRRQHGAFTMNVGNQGWEWAGPNLAGLARDFIASGLSGSELLDAVRSHASREMTLADLPDRIHLPGIAGALLLRDAGDPTVSIARSSHCRKRGWRRSPPSILL